MSACGGGNTPGTKSTSSGFQREGTSWKVLTDAGFQYLGEWTHDPASLLKLDAKAPTVPGVYAFTGLL
jgi:hypothetical protein